MTITIASIPPPSTVSTVSNTTTVPITNVATTTVPTTNVATTTVPTATTPQPHRNPQVFEAYLTSWWEENRDKLGPPPEGPNSIAIMRLVVQVQAEDKQRAILEAFPALRPDDQRMLADEMAVSGLVAQAYKRTAPAMQVRRSHAMAGVAPWRGLRAAERME